jgi:hypothetical protein
MILGKLFSNLRREKRRVVCSSPRDHARVGVSLVFTTLVLVLGQDLFTQLVLIFVHLGSKNLSVITIKGAKMSRGWKFISVLVHFHKLDFMSWERSVELFWCLYLFMHLHFEVLELALVEGKAWFKFFLLNLVLFVTLFLFCKSIFQQLLVLWKSGWHTNLWVSSRWVWVLLNVLKKEHSFQVDETRHYFLVSDILLVCGIGFGVLLSRLSYRRILHVRWHWITVGNPIWRIVRHAHWILKVWIWWVLVRWDTRNTWNTWIHIWRIRILSNCQWTTRLVSILFWIS